MGLDMLHAGGLSFANAQGDTRPTRVYDGRLKLCILVECGRHLLLQPFL